MRACGGRTRNRALRYPWTARPTETPALAARQEAGRTIASVSWNGATEVASWLIVGGETTDALAPLASSPPSGFETHIVLAARPPLLAARALDAAASVLGQSAVIWT